MTVENETIGKVLLFPYQYGPIQNTVKNTKFGPWE